MVPTTKRQTSLEVSVFLSNIHVNVLIVYWLVELNCHFIYRHQMCQKTLHFTHVYVYGYYFISLTSVVNVK